MNYGFEKEWGYEQEWYEPDGIFVCECCGVMMPLEELMAGCPVCGETMVPLALAELN